MKKFFANYRISFSDFLLIALCTSAATFLIAKAVINPITHDEAWSFQIMKKFWYAEAFCTGNTHWINSAAMKMTMMLGLENTWQLRWFSILSMCGFFVCGYCWIKNIRVPAMRLFAFALLFLNCYVQDYLIFARGYSGGLFFESLSILLFIKALYSDNRRLSFSSLFFAGLSAISNYSFIYFFAAFSSVYFFKIHFFSGKNFFKTVYFYLDAFFTAGIFFVVWKAMRFIMKCSGDVMGAGENDFLGMFKFMFEGIIYGKYTIPSLAVQISVIGLAAIIFLAAVYGVFRKHGNKLFFYSSLFFILMLIFILFNHFVFDVVFPWYRSALFLFPCMAIILVFRVQAVSFTFIRRILLGVVSAGLVVLFFSAAKIHFNMDYREQTDSKICFDKIEKGKRAALDPGLYGVYINYYQLTDKYKYSFTAESLYPNRTKTLKENEKDLSRSDYIVLNPPYDLSGYKLNNVKLKVEFVSPNVYTAVIKVIRKNQGPIFENKSIITPP